MKYHKPEILPLGSATLLIQGNKKQIAETSDHTKVQVPDADLDD